MRDMSGKNTLILFLASALAFGDPSTSRALPTKWSFGLLFTNRSLRWQRRSR